MHFKKSNHLKKILIDRNINHFIHCTPLENLSSILEHGIVSRKTLEKSDDVHGCITDPLRMDEHPEASCFSVQSPNFDHLRRIHKDFNHAAIIVVSVDLILNFKCAFYPRNAAKNDFKYKSLNHWQWSDRFEEMFSNDGPRVTKDGSPYPRNWTTYADAEVLAFGQIAPELIEQVAIKNTNQRTHFKAKHPDMAFIEFLPEWM